MYAIHHKAEYIWDFDDDNNGVFDLIEIERLTKGESVTVCNDKGSKLFSPYPYFGVPETRVLPRVLDKKCATITMLDKKYATITVLDKKCATITMLDKKYATITVLDKKCATITMLDKKYATTTVLDKKYATITVLDKKYMPLFYIPCKTFC
ncbi:Hypothetical predicted protein [Mytilus galloprovincialis]|uniref:Uncharacterized protein n=1 Tax=Mytilus galloprovincialis TaxID=29158 RepID=A0A8B6DNW0_MYTGA|nr:Hypothetical predicted protein [Mytilus galloprovincialis]